MADSHAGEAGTKLSFCHPDAVILLLVMVELIKQLLSPVRRSIGILTGPRSCFGLPNVSNFEETMERSCSSGFNDAVGVRLEKAGGQLVVFDLGPKILTFCRCCNNKALSEATLYLLEQFA